jgi:hypothetical protein
MIKKTLGNWVPRPLHPHLVRIAPFVRQIVFARVALTVLMVPSGVTAETSQSPGSTPPARVATAPSGSTTTRISDPTARAVELDLGGLFLTQGASGAYAFSDAHAGLAAHPLMASMSLDAFRTTGNKGALSQASYSIGRYYTYVIGSLDRDGDRLVESPAPWGGKDARAEDPAYNALFAVDLRALARTNLELRRIMPALHWYDASRMIARAVVAGTFDADAAYFFPNDAATNRMVRQWSAAGSFPIVFDEFVGPNLANVVVDRHVTRWTGDFSARADAETDPTRRAVDRLVGVDVLRATNRKAQADALRSLRVLSSSTFESIALYATERAMIDRPLKDADITFDLFNAVVRSSRKFTDPEVVKIEKSVPDVKALVYRSAAVSVETGEQSVRTLYSTVSQLRDKLRASSFWSAEDRAAFPGADATIATNRLLDDVALLLRRAENTLFAMRFESGGLRITTRFPKDAFVIGGAATLDWELSSPNRAFDLKSAMAGVYGESLAPLAGGKPFSVKPNTPLRFSSRHVLTGNAGSLRFVTFMLTVEDAAGNRGRIYVERSVYAHAPVGIRARFPKGTIIAGTTVPIELDMTRRARNSLATKYYWFSPGGLRLAEGNQGTFSFGPDDSAAVKLNVEIPTPCRPGVFPFTLKFFSGDREAGTIQASLFKPYQWAFVGAFAGKDLGKKFPPENGVALVNAYDAGRKKIQWEPVPASACGPNGDVVLTKLVDEPGVSYLYTVVAVAFETDIGARLVSNCPAALVVNG